MGEYKLHIHTFDDFFVLFFENILSSKPASVILPWKQTYDTCTVQEGKESSCIMGSVGYMVSGALQNPMSTLIWSIILSLCLESSVGFVFDKNK